MLAFLHSQKKSKNSFNDALLYSRSGINTVQHFEGESFVPCQWFSNGLVGAAQGESVGGYSLFSHILFGSCRYTVYAELPAGIQCFAIPSAVRWAVVSSQQRQPVSSVFLGGSARMLQGEQRHLHEALQVEMINFFRWADKRRQMGREKSDAVIYSPEAKLLYKGKVGVIF